MTSASKPLKPEVIMSVKEFFKNVLPNPVEIQIEAFDRFARERNVEVHSLPTGQGIVLKS